MTTESLSALGSGSVEGVFLISGIPGAGKTTVARLLASQFPLGAHIEADEIQNLISRAAFILKKSRVRRRSANCGYAQET